MSKILYIENYAIEEPVINILYHIRDTLNNGKLKDIIEKKDEIVCTCVSDEHSGGQEANPDLHINLREDSDVGFCVFHCFACGEKGDFIKFVALAFSQSYGWAKTWLIKNYGILAYERLSIGDPIKISAVQKKKVIDESILETLQPYCDYLRQRKISIDTCRLLNIKYDEKNKCIVFPCYDSHGKLVMLPTRSIVTKFFHLGTDIAKPVYCIDQIIKNNIKSAIITEGPFDAATGWEYGFPTIATLGSVSDNQIDIINKSCLQSLYLMFDNDAAGEKFTKEVKQNLDPRIIIHEVKIPNGFKDINDLDKETFWKILKIAKNN